MFVFSIQPHEGPLGAYTVSDALMLRCNNNPASYLVTYRHNRRTLYKYHAMGELQRFARGREHGETNARRIPYAPTCYATNNPSSVLYRRKCHTHARRLTAILLKHRTRTNIFHRNRYKLESESVQERTFAVETS